jgi:hypothetical protein
MTSNQHHLFNYLFNINYYKFLLININLIIYGKLSFYLLLKWHKILFIK